MWLLGFFLDFFRGRGQNLLLCKFLLFSDQILGGKSPKGRRAASGASSLPFCERKPDLFSFLSCFVLKLIKPRNNNNNISYSFVNRLILEMSLFPSILTNQFTYIAKIMSKNTDQEIFMKCHLICKCSLPFAVLPRSRKTLACVTEQTHE